MRKIWNKAKELKNVISGWIEEHDTICIFVEAFKSCFAYILAYFAALLAVCKIMTFFGGKSEE